MFGHLAVVLRAYGLAKGHLSQLDKHSYSLCADFLEQDLHFLSQLEGKASASTVVGD